MNWAFRFFGDQSEGLKSHEQARELAVITWIRHRYMETPIMSAAMQGGAGRRLGIRGWSADWQFLKWAGRVIFGLDSPF